MKMRQGHKTVIHKVSHLALGAGVLFFSTFTQPSLVKSQYHEFSVKDLRDPIVIRTLFAAIRIDSNGEALWKPNFGETFAFEVSGKDSLCHTALDTILEFDSRYGRIADVIFATYGYDRSGERSNCRICAPKLSIARFARKDSSWVLEFMHKDFQSIGGDGKAPEIHFREYGKFEYAIEFGTVYSNQGLYSTNLEMYDAINCDRIFGLTTHSEYVNTTERPDWSYDCNYVFVPSAKEPSLYDIIVTTKGTMPKEGVLGKVIKVNKRERYRFFGRYELVR